MQYIGRTYRRPGDRAKEHVPRWLSLAADKTARSSITEHIINERYACDKDECFEIIHRAKNSPMLKFVEAVAIRKLKPQLNVQKEFQYNLKLPW